MSVHTEGRINENWPLCQEAIAVHQGWSAAEIEDGELVDDPLISGGGEAEWFVPVPATCRDCLELVHA